jgi:division protein CdvB (Snf7/Vps24/ESCRT-III family)
MADRLMAAFKRADLMDNPAGIAKVIKDAAEETNRILDENGLLGK